MKWFFRKLLGPFVNFYSKNGEKKWNIKNYSINYIASPLYFFITMYVIKTYYVFPYWSFHTYKSAVGLSLISTAFYCYVSTFFQPDLDQEINRPGKHAFPFGDKISKFRWGSLLRDLFKPLTFVWYWSWHPYGKMFTHRGASHWPIWGVWTRIAWLFVVYLFVEGVIQLFHIPIPNILLYWKYWMKSFFPWNPEFRTMPFVLFALPVYLADFFHIAVDFFESTTKGTKFCPPIMKRGYIIKILGFMFSWPSRILKRSKQLDN
jgi:uncharacterized metal-binding protein